MIFADYSIFDWHWINTALPFIGLLGCTATFFSRKTCTAGKLVSTAVSLAMIMFLMLIWADWGSSVYEPSYQTTVSRCLVVIIGGLAMIKLKIVTIDRYRMEREIKVLGRKNQSLISENKRLKALSNRHNKRSKRLTKR